MLDGLNTLAIQHPMNPASRISLVRPIPKNEDCWGVLAPLRGTSWGARIPVISGEDFGLALHGHSEPLFRQLGPEPKHQLLKLPQEFCSLMRECVAADKRVCFPNAKVPHCYMPNVPPALTEAVRQLLWSWREGHYVVIVEGAELVLTRTSFLTKVPE